MARIKYSALVESIRGSIGGTTFQRNAYGYTIKAKPNMVNPNTSLQSIRKRSFQAAQAAWGSLTDTQRGYWDTYAATYPTPSQHNPDAYLSGFNLFVRWHAIEFQFQQLILTNPSGAQGSLVFEEYEIIRSGAVLEQNVSTSVLTEDWDLFVYLSQAISPTKAYNKSFTRYINKILSGNWPSSNIAASYNLRYGQLLNVGDLVAVDLTFKRKDNAQVLYIPSFVAEVIA
jgi:hypothetical protein